MEGKKTFITTVMAGSVF